jgi:DNA (cytosine-5)-methyltransferase 1
MSGKQLRYLSVCSGIEAASQAWSGIGFEPVAFSEIEPFPCAVLKHHYPTVPNWGDLTRFREWPDATVDLLVGGTPCQSFSVAGLRAGLADPRGNLALVYLAVADRYRPDWVVWENVPGVLSSNGGRDFGAFLGGLAELGYGWAYRVLDAQYFGVPQRRRRVFVVGHLGDWRRAAAVLFEPESLSGHPAPRRAERERIAPSLAARTRGGGGLGTDFECDGGLIPDVSPAMKARDAKGPSSDGDGDGLPLIPVAASLTGGGRETGPHGALDGVNLITHSLRANGFDTSEDGTGRGTPIIAIQDEATRGNPQSGPGGKGWRDDGAAFTHQADHVQAVFDPRQITNKDHRGGVQGDRCHALHSDAPAVAFANSAGDTALGMSRPGVPPLTRRNGDPGNVLLGTQIRRLTPRECTRLQGFPDTYLELTYADASEAHAAQILHELWRAAPTIAREGWRSGIVAALLTSEVLLAGVHGGWLSWSVAADCSDASGPIPSPHRHAEGFVRALRIAAEARYSPYRRESFEQCARELGAPLSQLPLEEPQARAALRDSSLWSDAQGAWPLRYAFATEAQRRSGKPAADGPRYKALGNSFAVPVVKWIGQRIQAVEALHEV